eukprot:scaffold10105_cov53-Attheya_sp.AAC.3
MLMFKSVRDLNGTVAFSGPDSSTSCHVLNETKLNRLDLSYGKNYIHSRRRPPTQLRSPQASSERIIVFRHNFLH